MPNAEQPAETEPAQQSLIQRLLAHSGVRYLLVGGSSFVLDFGILWLCHEVFGLEVWLATGIAFVCSFAYNYLLQKMFAFQSEISHTNGLVRYTMLVIFNTFATVGLVTLFAATPLGWMLGKVLTTAITTVWNYFAYRYLVFPSQPRQSAPTGSADTHTSKEL